MANIMAPAHLASTGAPTGAANRITVPRFIHGLAYGMIASILIWAIIALAIYKLV